MGTEENENHPVSLTDEPSEVTQEEPIEQVMTQETNDSGTAEYSDQEAFEETAKVEEEVEPEPSVSKHKTTRKATKPNSKLISDFDNKLKRYTDAGKKTDMTIRDIQKKIKDLDKRTSTKHQQIIQDLQTQVNDPRRKIDRIERSSRSRSNISIKKTSSKKNKDKSKKNAKKKTRRR
ncbi:MAG: hypothetical protein ACM3JQ_05915 [Candidatus Eiseniibacteriota bacterium]